MPKFDGFKKYGIDLDIEKKIRSLGFIQLWELQNEFKKSCDAYTILLKRNSNIFSAISFFFYDNFVPLKIKEIINSIK